MSKELSCFCFLISRIAYQVLLVFRVSHGEDDVCAYFSVGDMPFDAFYDYCQRIPITVLFLSLSRLVLI